ncbi:MAG: initiation control protein YabA [Aerococcaceae bacterium]|nr:initiation control protein YabA [Aerococcaceae bacterium]
MEQAEIQQLFEQIDVQFMTLTQTITQLKTALSVVVEENNRLRMLTSSAQTVLPTMPSNPSQNPTPENASGKERLLSFYQEGIHICHTSFGSRRLADEECLFCQGIIDELRES